MDEERQLIVIVEDDSGLRRAVERLLRLSGFRTRSFHSAEDANVFELASAARCLVIDVQLPGISGPAFYGSLHVPRPRSGMTTVSFQGQGGGLPHAEWTLASVLKQAKYNTYFTGKWHLGEADYALPNAQDYDDMKYVGFYHLNAYTYSDPKWFPDMDEQTRAMFAKVTRGMLSGKAGEKPHEDFKVNGEYVDTPDKGVVGIPYLDRYIEKASLDDIDDAAKKGQPFFVSINFMKVHQPNMPAPEYIGKSMAKTKYDGVPGPSAEVRLCEAGYAARLLPRLQAPEAVLGRVPEESLHSQSRWRGGAQLFVRRHSQVSRSRGPDAPATRCAFGLTETSANRLSRSGSRASSRAGPQTRKSAAMSSSLRASSLPERHARMNVS